MLSCRVNHQAILMISRVAVCKIFRFISSNGNGKTVTVVILLGNSLLVFLRILEVQAAWPVHYHLQKEFHYYLQKEFLKITTLIPLFPAFFFLLRP